MDKVMLVLILINFATLMYVTSMVNHNIGITQHLDMKVSKTTLGIAPILERIDEMENNLSKINCDVRVNGLIEVEKVLNAHLQIAKLKLEQDLDPESVFRLFTKGLEVLKSLKGKENEELARRAEQLILSIGRYKDRVHLTELIVTVERDIFWEFKGIPEGKPG